MGNPSSKNQSSANDDFITVKTYNGETKAGKRHGRGVYFYPNGDMYDGEWRKSKRYGRGVYTYSNGQKLEGFFYKDEYIGKKPNDKITRRMERKQIKYGDRIENYSVTEQTDVSNDTVLDDNMDTAIRLKSEGSNRRRVESVKRNKWIRDKYKITGSSESLDSGTRKDNKNAGELLDVSTNVKRSYSFGGKIRRGISADEAEERRKSKRLRESIRQKYNLKGRRGKDLLGNSE